MGHTAPGSCGTDQHRRARTVDAATPTAVAHPALVTILLCNWESQEEESEKWKWTKFFELGGTVDNELGHSQCQSKITCITRCFSHEAHAQT
jgi:hypothetical protein